MLPRAIWVLCLSILILKNGSKNKVDPIFLGGGGHLLPSPWIRHLLISWKLLILTLSDNRSMSWSAARWHALYHADPRCHFHMLFSWMQIKAGSTVTGKRTIWILNCCFGPQAFSAFFVKPALYSHIRRNSEKRMWMGRGGAGCLLTGAYAGGRGGGGGSLRHIIMAYHNGVWVLSSSTYMTDLGADKHTKQKKNRKIMGGGQLHAPYASPPPPGGATPGNVGLAKYRLSLQPFSSRISFSKVSYITLVEIKLLFESKVVGRELDWNILPQFRMLGFNTSVINSIGSVGKTSQKI